MPRARQRACLEQGLKLDINNLARQGHFCPGTKFGPISIQWTRINTTIVSGLITANMHVEDARSLTIQVGTLDQRIDLGSQPRPFGGRQWYFKCPVTRRYCSVLWMPPGATRFCSRQAWGRQAAYASQFASPVDRAFRGQAKIKSRLIGTCDPDEWDLPPKPKWMRWSTYNRHMQRFVSYEDTLDRHSVDLVARLTNRG